MKMFTLPINSIKVKWLNAQMYVRGQWVDNIFELSSITQSQLPEAGLIYDMSSIYVFWMFSSDDERLCSWDVNFYMKVKECKLLYLQCVS